MSPQVFANEIAKKTNVICLAPYEELRSIAQTQIELHPDQMIDLVKAACEHSLVADVFAPKVLYLRKSDAELSWGKP
jgi:hypothetical protein